MPLYVIPVPTPAAGHDWQYTVPGQYLEHITAVTAQLLTTAPALTVPDESGNGNTATPNAGVSYTIGNPGPFGSAVDNYSVFGPDSPSGINEEYARGPNSAAFEGAAFSADQWCYVSKPGSGFGAGLFGFESGFLTSNRLALNVAQNLHDPYDIAVESAGPIIYTLSGVASRGAWHHIGVSYDGTNIAIYVDGTLVDTRAHALPGDFTDVPCLGGNHSLGVARGFCSAPAFYPSALPAGSFAAHAAATGSWAAYKAAVLADSPSGLWNIGKPSDGAARTVLLEITDGTHVVTDIPPGTVTGVSVNGFAYSWQSNLNSSTVTPDGTSTTVAMPDLILPAGYTIGTRTLGLKATDQWSNINIWWSSDIMDAIGFRNDYVYPPGVRLVYQQRAGA